MYGSGFHFGRLRERSVARILCSRVLRVRAGSKPLAQPPSLGLGRGNRDCVAELSRGQQASPSPLAAGPRYPGAGRGREAMRNPRAVAPPAMLSSNPGVPAARPAPTSMRRASGWLRAPGPHHAPPRRPCPPPAARRRPAGRDFRAAAVSEGPGRAQQPASPEPPPASPWRGAARWRPCAGRSAACRSRRMPRRSARAACSASWTTRGS